MPENPGHYPHADTLKEIRESRGLSVEKAANLVGVTRGTWHTWESGTWPRMSKLVKVVEQFNVPPEAIGLKGPDGWELVPAKWIQDKFEEIIDLLEHR